MKKDIYLMKPQFVMAYNHDPKCLDIYAKYGVSEIWAGVYLGKKSIFASGRPHQKGKDKIITYDDLGKDFTKAKILGIKTNFLLNPGCSGNVEFSKDGMRELVVISEFLNDYKIDYITLSQPFMIKVFQKLSPEVKIKFSSHYNVNAIGKFRMLFDYLNVNEIIVSQFANKNFKLLREVVNKWDPKKLEIMCTVPCITGCPFRNWHAQFYGHSIELPDEDYIPTLVPCVGESHHNKNIAVSASFVRREDIIYYQKLGINQFKIGERRDPTENNIKCLEYYAGAIDDYVPFFRKSKILNKINLKAMDGFYDKFFNEECDGTKHNCTDCGHCLEYGEKVFLHTKEEILAEGIPETKEYLNDILLRKWLEEFDKI